MYKQLLSQSTLKIAVLAPDKFYLLKVGLRYQIKYL